MHSLKSQGSESNSEESAFQEMVPREGNSGCFKTDVHREGTGEDVSSCRKKRKRIFKKNHSSFNSSDVEDSPSSEESEENYSYKSDNEREKHYFTSKSKLIEESRSEEAMETSQLKISVSSPHFCSYCNYSTMYRCDLREHLRSHAEHPYKCPLCGNVCSNNGNLKRHMMLHTGEFPFKCSECNERFRTNHYLNVHRLKHSGQRPFKCQQCPAAFIQRSHLKKHSLKHRNLQLKCSYCDFTSEFPKVFKNHLLCHSETLRFQCLVCDYRVETNTHLSQHMLKHTENRPFKCHLCGCSFKYKNSLERHAVEHCKQD